MQNQARDVSKFMQMELSRVLRQLNSLLKRQRERGRTAAVDAVQGYAIEEGEAEGLIAELDHDLAQPPSESHWPTSSWAVADRLPASLFPGEGAQPNAVQTAIISFELNHAEYDALLLALAVELDPRFGRLVAFLNDHVGRTRPTLGMVCLMGAEHAHTATRRIVDWLERPAIRDGLLLIEGEGPLPGLTLRVPLEIVARLTSLADIPDFATSAWVQFRAHRPGLLDRLILPESLRDQALAWANQLQHSSVFRPLILVGAEGSGRQSLAEAIAAEAGWSVTVVQLEKESALERLRDARREVRWHRSALLLRLGAGSLATPSDWSLLWQETSTLAAPLFLILTPAQAERAQAWAWQAPAVVSIGQPDLAQRIGMWHALLPVGHQVTGQACERLAARFRFGPGAIHRAVRRAVSQSDLQIRDEGEACITEQDLEYACRELGGAQMGSLAQKIPLPFIRRDLVIPEHLQVEFDLALAWVRQQHRVLHAWGFANRIPYGRGLTALFAGVPGTGKTMAAQVLARELGVDLYRVDFSRLMSKWIGETEKNLSQLFDEAHAAGVALLFDEGDAVAGKRSEVKDARDRYANIEVSYLLQRMEEHEGITIFATNRLGDLDEAFTRRFHVVLDFPKPNVEHRLKIWQGMFPSQAELGDDLDLANCAQQYELTGGEIKNVVLAASFLAAQSGQAIGAQHIQMGVQRELIKSGRLSEI